MRRALLSGVIIIITYLSFGCFNYETNDSIYIIPDGYQGNVMIIFNQKDGSSIKYLDDKRLYVIPQSGVLRIDGKPQTGVGVVQFIYRDSHNNERKLKYMNSSDWKNNTLDSTTTACWNISFGEKMYTKDRVVNYEIFTVGPIKDAEKLSDQRSDFVWSNLPK